MVASGHAIKKKMGQFGKLQSTKLTWFLNLLLFNNPDIVEMHECVYTQGSGGTIGTEWELGQWFGGVMANSGSGAGKRTEAGRDLGVSGMGGKYIRTHKKEKKSGRT